MPNASQGLRVAPEPPPEETEKTITHDFPDLMGEPRDPSMPRSDAGTLARAEQTLAGIRAVQVRAQLGQPLSDVERIIVEAITPPEPRARCDERTRQIVCKLDTLDTARASGRAPLPQSAPFSPVTSPGYAALYAVVENTRHDLASRAPETAAHWDVLVKFLEGEAGQATQFGEEATGQREAHIKEAQVPRKYLKWARDKHTNRWWKNLQQSTR